MGNEKEIVAKNECVALAKQVCRAADKVIEEVAGYAPVADGVAIAAYRLSTALGKLNALRPGAPKQPTTPEPAPAPQAKKKVATKKKKATKKKATKKKPAKK